MKNEPQENGIWPAVITVTAPQKSVAIIEREGEVGWVGCFKRCVATVWWPTTFSLVELEVYAHVSGCTALNKEVAPVQL